MDLRFQPSLIQEVIDAFIEKTEREGDPTFYKEFHELADPIYENFPLDDREPEFKVGNTPGEESLILARYRVLWCLSIDSRLTRIEKEPVFPKEQRLREFSTWYRKIPGKQLVAVFEGLWATEHFTHPELIEMATDT